MEGCGWARRVRAQGLFIFGSRALITAILQFPRQESGSVCKGDLEYVLSLFWRRMAVALVKKQGELLLLGVGFQKEKAHDYFGCHLKSKQQDPEISDYLM